MRRFLFLAAAIVLGGCATSGDYPGAVRYCQSDAILLDTHFEGGNFHSCEATGDENFTIRIVPEDAPPINVSPWYAFRVSPKRAANAELNFTFEDGYARYWPKFSLDGENWERAPESAVSFSEDNTQMTLRVNLTEKPLYIAGQELLTHKYFEQWLTELADQPGTTARAIGASAEGRPIVMASTTQRPEVILLLGRAHPPEITGTLAMRPFLNVLLGDTELARSFRQRFMLVTVPLLNPDGVARGHWRHNVSGVDLNRDWGIFSQPETQSVAAEIEKIDQRGQQIKMMLDFHSTMENLFYTQIPEESHTPVDFASAWLGASRDRLPGYEFKHDARPTSEQANSKNYFHTRYKIAAITYELGDETDRAEIERVTPIFAEEFMRAMLELPK